MGTDGRILGGFWHGSVVAHVRHLLRLILLVALALSAGAGAALAATATITNVYLPDGAVGVPYSATLTASGDFAASSWSLGGAIPPGLSIEPGSNTISGTPGVLGDYDAQVSVIDGGGQTVTKLLTIHIEENSINPPTITSLSDNIAPVTGNTNIRVNGANFVAATRALVGGALASVTVIDANTLTVTAPPGVDGLTTLTVLTAGGSASVPFYYYVKPVLISIAPDQGPVGGGTSVVITGTGFAGASGGVYQVNIGSKSSPHFTVDSDTQITAVMPAGQLGSVGISLTKPMKPNAYVQSDILSNAFTYVSNPLQIDNTSLPAGVLNQLYLATITASGGEAPYSFSATGLPAGLSLKTNGGFDGSPSAVGSYDVTFTVTDHDGAVANRTLTLDVNKVGSTVTATANPTTAPYGDTLTLNVTVVSSLPGGILPSGTVHALVDGTILRTVELDVHSADTMIADDIPAGDHQLTVTYDGNSLFLPSATTTPFAFTVTARSTSTTVSASPAGEVASGTSVTYTATVTKSGGAQTPVGEVQFKVGGVAAGGPVSLVNGVATTDIVVTDPAAITAEYLGNDNFVASTSDPLQQAVTGTPMATGTVLQVSSPADLNAGASVTATVARTDDGSPASGSIRFDYTGTTTGTIIPLNASGVATFTVPTETRGTSNVGATYLPDAGYLGSSDIKPLTVVAPVTVVVSSDAATAAEGEHIHFSAQLTAADNSSLEAEGQVAFFSDGAPIGLSGINASNVGTIGNANLSPGAHAITATYTPLSDDYRALPSNSFTQTITGTATVATTFTPNPPVYNGQMNLIATVSGTPTPTGSVEFFINGSNFGSAPLDQSGVATLPFTLSTGSPVSLVAKYQGDSIFAPAEAPAVTIAAPLRPATLTASASNDNTVVGQTITFSADVASDGTPIQPTVRFYGSTDVIPRGNFTNATPDANGHGVSFLITLNAGTWAISAQSDAYDDYAPSNEVDFTVVVAKGPGTTTLSSSAINPVIAGQSVTLTAQVSDYFNNGGTVTFYDGNTNLGSAPVSPAGFAQGSASLAVNSLAVGAHDLTASFSGNINENPATSDVLQQVVDAPLAAPTTGAVNLEVAYGSSANPVTPALSGGAADSVAIADPADHGTATASDLAITYTPNPTFTGTDTFTYTTKNDTGTSAPATVTITVDPPAPVVLPATALADASVGAAYAATIDPASGGSGSYTYAVIGSLPAWLSFDSANRSFSGTPTATGSFPLAIRATDTSTGDGPFSVDQTYMLRVRDSGSVTIREETDGTDAVFGFTSPTPALNLSLSTIAGHGDSGAITLPPGSYSITANDMSGAGFGLAGLACSGGDSAADTRGRTVNLNLAAGEALVCTFTTVSSRDRTTSLIGDFLDARAELILANQPDAQRRIDRLNGVSGGGGEFGSALMGYLPSLTQGTPINVSTSLGAINRMAGNEQPDRLDLWMEGTFALFDTSGSSGRFNLATVGADYLVNHDLLLGGFVQVDGLAQQVGDNNATASGIGWLAGPYATMRLSQNLYLDVLAGAGTSSNTISPYGTYDDDFGAMRWLVSTSLQGQWQAGDLTLSPRAQFSYFKETTNGYTDSLGVDIPSVTSGLGQLAIGSGISYRFNADGDVVIDTGLRLDGVGDISTASGSTSLGNAHGRVEGSLDLTLGGGARFGLSATYDGVGSTEQHATSAKITLSAPMH